MAKHGLFKVSDRIWQVRGFDIANITFVKGDTGWIVIDTLTSERNRKSGLRPADRTCWRTPITAVIYTHLTPITSRARPAS